MAADKSTFSPLANLLTPPAEWGVRSPLTAVIATLVVLVLSAWFLLRRKWDGKMYEPGGVPVVATWSFFTRRHDFMLRHFGKSGADMFRFRILQFVVTALRGEKARKVFFNDQSLDMVEGYSILQGGSPSLEDIKPSEKQGPEQTSIFVKRVLGLMRKDRVTDALPLLFEDVHTRMLAWGNEGRINPFKNVYDLVFQMTVRLATCRELAEDHEAIEKLAAYYWDIEKSATPFAIHFPWFPGSAKKTKEKATLNLYLLLSHYVTLRRDSPTPSTDPIDILMGEGASNDDIIQTIMGITFAGVINTGVNSCWALLHLGTNPVWKQKAIGEYKALVAKYTNTISSDPLHKRLSSIPLNAWETELPSVDLVIRESLRISTTGTALRRNLEKDIKVDGVTIKRGDFLAYPLQNVHMNPEIYTDPTKFDPDRFTEGREEDRKETFGFLGWGVGRHPCAGMKIAKLEIKLILAIMLLGYEYELVDDSGKYPKSLPEQDRNDVQQARPLGEPCYLKFKRVEE